MKFNVAAGRIDMPSIAGGEVNTLRPKAEKAVLKVKDKLIAINGRAVNTIDDYLEKIAKANPDENMNFTAAEAETKYIKPLENG